MDFHGTSTSQEPSQPLPTQKLTLLSGTPHHKCHSSRRNRSRHLHDRPGQRPHPPCVVKNPNLPHHFPRSEPTDQLHRQLRHKQRHVRPCVARAPAAATVAKDQFARPPKGKRDVFAKAEPTVLEAGLALRGGADAPCPFTVVIVRGGTDDLELRQEARGREDGADADGDVGDALGDLVGGGGGDMRVYVDGLCGTA